MRMKGKALRLIKGLLFVTLPTIIAVFVFLELFFRFIIPANNPPRGYFDETEKIFRLSRKPEAGMCTIGKFAEIRTEWRVNNMGWNYPVDYYPQEGRKLIAVIGDSFIEALEVDSDRKYPFLLREMLLPEYEVYAFGRGGAPLSQYLHVSRYVREHFDPEILVFNICYNDFVESVYELNPIQSYYMQLSITDDRDISEIMPEPDYSHYQYRPFIRFISENSAVIRYFYSNLRLRSLIRDRKDRRDDLEGNIFFRKAEEEKETVMIAADYIIGRIAQENSDRRVIFIMDGPREAIYSSSVAESRITWMNEMAGSICERHNVEFIDLTGYMAEDYMENKRKFNSEINHHYNEYGHLFVSEILYDHLKNTAQKAEKPGSGSDS